MIPAAIAPIVIGVILLVVFPWGGIVAAAVGLVLLIAALLGVGRRAATRDTRA